VPKSLRPIFCDRNDFSAGHSLTEQTVAALMASEFLIVICSPKAARSKYVNEEIRQFKAMGRSDRIIPLIIDGEPNDAERECFPPALRFRIGSDGELTNVREEPIAADARAPGDGRELAKLKVVAGLIGLPLDEVVRRAECARKRGNRIRISLACSFLLLFAAAFELWILNEQGHDQLIEWANGLNKNIEQKAARGEAPVRVLLSDLADQEKRTAGTTIDTPRLRYIRAQTLIIFSDGYQTLGRSQEALSRAKRASEMVNDLIAQTVQDGWWRHFLSVAYQKLTGIAQPGSSDLQYHLSVAFQKIGNSLSSLDRWGVALDWYRRSLDLSKAFTAVDPSKTEWQSALSLAHDKIGDAWKGLGNLDSAQTSYAASLAIRNRLAAADSDNPRLQRDLASTYDRLSDIQRAQGNWSGALESEEQSIRIVAHFYAIDGDNNDWRRNLALNYRKLADIRHDRGEIAAALDGYHKSFELTEELNRQDANNALWKRDLAACKAGIGTLLNDQGKFGEAEESFRSAIAILKPLAASDASNTDWQRDLAVIYDQIGTMLGRRAVSSAPLDGSAKAASAEQTLLQALENYSLSLAIRESLSARDSENLLWRYELGGAHGNLATVLSAQGKFAEARHEFEIARKIFDEVSSADPGNPLFRHDLATATLRAGDALSSQGDLAGALVSYRESLGIAQGIMVDNIRWQHELAITHAIIAETEKHLGNQAVALVELHKARDIMAALVNRLPQSTSELARLDAEIAALQDADAVKVAN